jgi:peptide/nickel transport system substrate-binding protein
MKTPLLPFTIALGMALSGSALAQSAPGAVTIVVPEAINVIDSCSSESNPIGRVVVPNLAEPLTQIDPDSGAVKPRLATSWEQNGSTWRFHLREGVKFQDGSPFTAAAVKSTIDRTINPATECENDRYFKAIKVTMNVVDDNTIDITTDPFQPVLPLLMAKVPIVSTTAKTDGVDRAPIGTGPYALDSWPSPEQVTLKRFDGYWGTKPEVESVKFVYRADSAVQAAMVASGEADLAPYIAVQDATNPKTDIPYLNTETPYVMIPLDVPPLNDIRVRKALNMAIDRNAFIGSLISKDALPAAQIVVSFINGYNPDLKPWPYDPDQAKKLLAEAKADGVPVDSEITLYGNLGLFPNMTDIESALAQMWRSVGLNIKETIAERSQFVSMVANPHPANMAPSLFINSHDNSTGDASNTLYYKYHSTGGQAFTHDAELDRLIQEGAASSGEERTKDFQQAFYRINQEIVADVPLFHLVGYARVSPRIHFKPTTITNNEVEVEDITFAK